MTQVLINLEVVKAIGLSIAFMGVMLSIVTIGISFLIYKISKKKGKCYLVIGGFITIWAIYTILNSQLSSEINYIPRFFVYSTIHLFSIFVGTIIIIIFPYLFSKFCKKKIFNKKIFKIVWFFVILSILMRLIFPLFQNPYLGLINRLTIIIPPLLCFFMIIKSYIGKNND